jgi:hypothetical protein
MNKLFSKSILEIIHEIRKMDKIKYSLDLKDL